MSALTLDFRVGPTVGYADGRDTRAPTAVRTLKMDEAELAALYRDHAPAIFAHCRRLLHNPTTARDAMQEAFMRILAKGPARLQGQDALRYLYRVSTNVCLNQMREQRVHDRAKPTLLSQGAGSAGAESGHADRQFAAALLERTDDTGAAIAVMHFIDGLSQVEVADTLGITRRTVFNRLRKLEKLAADLLLTRAEAEAAEHARTQEILP